MSTPNSSGETVIELFQKHDSSTPFNTYERKIHGFNFSCYSDHGKSVGKSSNSDDVEKVEKVEKRIYEITEEIKGLLNPNNYEGDLFENTSESNENGLLKLKYYYIYGNIKDYNSETAKIIDLSYHSFVKINKRLHSIMDKTHHDLTNNQEGHNIDYPSDKDYFALGFYNDPTINDNENDYVRLDLFFYNSFSYYDIFGLDDFFGELNDLVKNA